MVGRNIVVHYSPSVDPVVVGLLQHNAVFLEDIGWRLRRILMQMSLYPHGGIGEDLLGLSASSPWASFDMSGDFIGMS